MKSSGYRVRRVLSVRMWHNTWSTAGHEVRGLDSFDNYYARSVESCATRSAVSARQAANCCEVDLAEPGLDASGGGQRDRNPRSRPARQFGGDLPSQPSCATTCKSTWCLLQALRDSPSLQFFINVSTSSVYGHEATAPESAAAQPVSHYGVTKLAAEQLVMARQREDGFPACSLRLVLGLW